ncbi:MAG: hypothetical protein H7258_03730 [Ferruginibacter sp.]|nr:hypothetical protein [Ferruginibacter sp.]
MINRLKRLNGSMENKMAGPSIDPGMRRHAVRHGEGRKKLLVKENLWSAISF